MTYKQETIIDGVDVSGCKFSGFSDIPMSSDNFKCSEPFGYSHCSRNYNCYYKQLQRKTAELDEYKKSKQSSYEALQARANELEMSNRKLKQECEELKDKLKSQKAKSKKLRAKLRAAKLVEKINRSVIDTESERANEYEKALAPFNDEYFKGLDTKQIAELAKKSIRLTTENRKLEAVLDEIEEIASCEKIDIETNNEVWLTKYILARSCQILDIISKATGEL